MVTKLDDQLEEFSKANRVRCFLHIVNLVAKSLLKQFDVNTKRGESADPDAEQLDDLLVELTKDFEYEESLTQELDSVDDKVDDEDGMLVEDKTLTEEEQAAIDADIHPVKLVLAKVSNRKNNEAMLTQGHSAAQTGFQGDSFDNNPPARVECVRQRTKVDRTDHASRCADPLELHIRYAGVLH
jgi:hypothetical protein